MRLTFANFIYLVYIYIERLLKNSLDDFVILYQYIEINK